MRRTGLLAHVVIVLAGLERYATDQSSVSVYVRSASCLDDVRTLVECLEPGTVLYLVDDEGRDFRAVVPRRSTRTRARLRSVG